MSQNKDAEKAFFDRIGESGDYDVFDARGYQRILDEFLLHMEGVKRPGMKVVDLGCGTAAFTARLIGRGYELHGMDISAGCIEHAQKKYPSISLKTGDIEHTGYENDFFDVVILSGVLHHFPDFSAVLGECYRILKHEGIVLAYDPHRANPFMWLYRCKESPFYSSKGVTENEQPLDGRKVREIMQSCGFREVKVSAVSGVTFRYVDSRLAFLILPVYNIIERILDLKAFRGTLGSFLISCGKK